MRMLKSILVTAAATLLVASCTPPPDVPPPRFKPRPPLPPERLDPYGETMDPYGNPPPNPPPPQQPTRPGEYPTATRTANPNEVISPFAPYNVIDVEGFRSGQLARDPSNNQIFRVP
jgi:hypothetical protein